MRRRRYPLPRATCEQTRHLGAPSYFSALAPAVRSTSGKERNPRSRCHCRCAATKPEASRRAGDAELSTLGQSPSANAASKLNVAGAGCAEPEGGSRDTHNRPRVLRMPCAARGYRRQRIR